MKTLSKTLGTAAVCIGLFLSQGKADAQFFVSGSDPASIKWNTIKSDNYKVLYPRGLDSLATAYIKNLEYWRERVGASAGFKPGERYINPTPVILHPFTVTSNGAVVWAPRRMDLFTCPNLTDPEPIPWMQNLGVHESRHVAQMQFGRSGFFAGFHYVFGEMFAGAMAGVFPSTALLEGDAVTAETALTSAGRGRSDNFLRQYRISLDNGDFRNWWQWRYGSQKKNTPDHYAAGYFAISGARYAFDTPHFTDHYFGRILRRGGFAFWNWQKTFKELSGEETFSDAFRRVSDTYAGIWKDYDSHRSIMALPATRVTRAGRFYAKYTNMAAAPDGVYVIKTSLDKADELHFIDSTGKDSFVRPMSSSIGRLVFHQGKLYWSENVPNLRWELGNASRIRYIRHHGTRIHNVTRKTRLFNPSFKADTLLAIDCRVNGTAAIMGGPETPPGVQLTETASDGERIYAIGLSDEGLGIYLFDGEWKTVLTPSKVRLHTLNLNEGKLYFVSDLDGTDEVYSLTGDNLRRLTDYKYGASDYCLAGNTIYLTIPGTDGEHLYSESLDALKGEAAHWDSVYVSPVVKKLVAQSQSLLPEGLPDGNVEISSPKKYCKASGLLHVHSWAPFYIHVDEENDVSFQESTEAVRLGATAFFQNLLGTASGTAAIGRQHSYGNKDYRAIGNISFTWRGWYPVLTATLTFNEEDAIGYTRYRISSEGMTMNYVSAKAQDKTSFDACLKAYVPLNLSSGGWSRGVVPQVVARFTNSTFDKSLYYTNMTDQVLPGTTYRVDKGESANVCLVTSSVRAYVKRPVPNSAIYPRWGLGAEVGYRFRPALDDIFSPGLYAYAYGYVPGLVSTHGVKLSAIWQRLDAGMMRENTVTTRPRGFADTGINSYLALNQQNQFKATIDYALPLLSVDWGGISPFAYVRNFELIPHYDLALISKGSLTTAGIDIMARLENFLWFPYTTKLGISINYNGGSAYDKIKDDAGLKKTYVKAIFSVDL